MNEHKYSTDNRERILVPCEMYGCEKMAPYLKGDMYRKRFCSFHYNLLKQQMIDRGASAEEISARLLEVFE